MITSLLEFAQSAQTSIVLLVAALFLLLISFDISIFGLKLDDKKHPNSHKYIRSISILLLSISIALIITPIISEILKSSEITRLKSETTDYQSEINELEKSLKAKTAQLKNKETEISKLKSSISSIEEIYTKEKADNQNLKSDFDKLRNKLNEVNKQKTAYIDENKTNSEIIKELQALNNKFINQIDELDQERQKLIDQISEQKRQINELTSDKIKDKDKNTSTDNKSKSTNDFTSTNRSKKSITDDVIADVNKNMSDYIAMFLHENPGDFFTPRNILQYISYAKSDSVEYLSGGRQIPDKLVTKATDILISYEELGYVEARYVLYFGYLQVLEHVRISSRGKEFFERVVQRHRRLAKHAFINRLSDAQGADIPRVQEQYRDDP